MSEKLNFALALQNGVIKCEVSFAIVHSTLNAKLQQTTLARR